MLVLAMLLSFSTQATACVGKVLYIGIANSPTEQLIAEMVAVLVTERTGTSVKIVSFKDAKAVYAAARKGEIGLLIENRDRAFDMIGKPRDNNSRTAQETLRREYQKTLNMVWLDSLGGSPPYAPVLSTDTLSSLPALPKLLNKLSGILTEDAYNKLVKSAKSDEKPKKVARDFLKAKRLI
ncbi:substrate binding domain of ABC-type glycine betaine transport system [Geobacter sp. OR-1]|nr:substrate binding domain of ABC-type glycine betaine transport system [Geobacter sp. OR-1]